MFRNVRVPILGMIENMSYYQCPNCGHSAHIFGKDGAKRTAEDFNMELLGQVSPLVLLIIIFREYLGHQQGRPCGHVFPERCNATGTAMLGSCPCERLKRLQVPLEIGIRETSDAGSPIVTSQPESKEAQVYASIAERVKQKLDRYATLREDQQKAQTKA